MDSVRAAGRGACATALPCIAPTRPGFRRTAVVDALDEADAEADYEAFLRECDAARAAVAGRSLDDVVPSRGDHPGRKLDLRWIYVHMIEEYARHNGHADLIREAIDGVTGD